MTLEESAKKSVNGDVHLEFARDILERLGSGVSSKSFHIYSNTQNFANAFSGEEKKTLAPLLAKLHISPSSTPSLLREIYAEVSLAIDEKLIADATGRNALFKIHVSLGKIVNTLKEKDDEQASLTLNLRGSVNSMTSRKSSIAPSVVDEEKSVLSTIEGEAEEELEKVEEEDDDEGTIIGNPTPKRRSGTRDSLVEELLSDGDVDMSGV